MNINKQNSINYEQILFICPIKKSFATVDSVNEVEKFQDISGFIRRIKCKDKSLIILQKGGRAINFHFLR